MLEDNYFQGGGTAPQVTSSLDALRRSAVIILALVLSGCSDLFGPPTCFTRNHEVYEASAFTISSLATLTADTLRVSMGFSNQGTTLAEIQFGWCAFGVRAVSDRGFIYDNLSTYRGNCPDITRGIGVQPGETTLFPIYVGPASGLRRPGPKSEYRVFTYFKYGAARACLVRDAGTVWI